MVSDRKYCLMRSTRNHTIAHYKSRAVENLGSTVDAVGPWQSFRDHVVALSALPNCEVLRNLAYGNSGRHKLMLLKSGVIKAVCEAGPAVNIVVITSIEQCNSSCPTDR